MTDTDKTLTYDETVALVKRFLISRQFTLWGEAHDLSQPASVDRAARWFVRQIAELDEFAQAQEATRT